MSSPNADHATTVPSPVDTPRKRPLRALTYLSPSLPVELFELVTDHLAQQLDREITLEVNDRHSGPMHSDHDPFAASEVDLAFLCSPSYLYLRSLAKPSVELVPAGFVFQDMRIASRAVYFSEVVVRADSEAATFADLEGRVWGYNDRHSLSGYFSASQHLRELGRNRDFFGKEVDTGSHLRSIEGIVRGDIDAASIDSNVLSRVFEECPSLVEQLRVLESWGPFPIQPIVVNSDLAGELVEPITNALLDITRVRRLQRRLAALGVLGFARTSADEYEEEGCELRSLGLIA